MYHEFPQAHLDLLLGNGLSTLYMQVCLEIGGCFQPCPFTAVEMPSYDKKITLRYPNETWFFYKFFFVCSKRFQA